MLDYPDSDNVPTREQRKWIAYHLACWLGEPDRKLREVLTGDLVQECEHLVASQHVMFMSDLGGEDELTGKLIVAMDRQREQIERELHERFFVRRTAPAYKQALIGNDAVRMVKERTDLVDLFSHYGVDLKATGAKAFKGLCCFHDDQKTPNLYVYNESQRYYCFACHATGDCFDLVKAKESVSFYTAVRTLAARVNMALPDFYDSAKAREIGALCGKEGDGPP